jgi:hypothetical protein
MLLTSVTYRPMPNGPMVVTASAFDPWPTIAAVRQLREEEISIDTMRGGTSSSSRKSLSANRRPDPLERCPELEPARTTTPRWRVGLQHRVAADLGRRRTDANG